jgi:hypothetical protein
VVLFVCTVIWVVKIAGSGFVAPHEDDVRVLPSGTPSLVSQPDVRF